MGEISFVHEFIVISKASSKKADLVKAKEKFVLAAISICSSHIPPYFLDSAKHEVLCAEVGHKLIQPRLNQLREILTNCETVEREGDVWKRLVPVGWYVDTC